MYKKTWYAAIMVVSLLIVAITPVHSEPNQTSIAEQIQVLIDLVDEINLQTGIINCLDAKIETVKRALSDINDNNDLAALNAIKTLISIVEIQRGKQLTEDQANILIEAAGPLCDDIEWWVTGTCPICGGTVCVPPCPNA
ncbi:hypothetical protein ACFL5H_03715 [Candidatus Latescibacterota bacterium]